ncbi:MAG: CotH kinase family protein, partial [Wujia sp.]
MQPPDESGGMQPPDESGGMQPPDGSGEMQIPGGKGRGSGMQPPDRNIENGKMMQGREDRTMGEDDVSLIYSDDDYDSYSNIFDNAKTDVTDDDKDRLIASLKQLNEGENIENVVNVDEVIRYFVVHNFVCNFDSYTGSMIHNYYLYEEDGQMSMIPWDYNLAFGGFAMGEGTDAAEMVNYPIDTPVSGGTIDSRPMLAWIFANEEYTEIYHEYFTEFIESYFDSGYFEELIDSTDALIAPYVEKDPTKFCTCEEYQKGVETLREFCLLRAESISGQLNGSIPSTSDGQTEDDSNLVDASGIVISDMGSMGNMGGGKEPRSENIDGGRFMQ